MGLFDKLANRAKEMRDKAIRSTLDTLENKAAQIGVGAPSNVSRQPSPVPPPPPIPEEEDIDDDEFFEETFEEFDEDAFDEDFDEDEYEDEEFDDESDEDLQELADRVDTLIEEDGLDEDTMEELYEEADSFGISREEFDNMLDARIEELRSAIDAGFDREEVFATRTPWRRCPKCGWLNHADNVYCDWCGYQLRHRAASTIKHIRATENDLHQVFSV
ncbi:MAG: zinc ribbon domain-containing protein, partial [Muribaculaceae bacterium]|nr:zinc ribbon domain-containing protein [Muribaculaceae bacterium]